VHNVHLTDPMHVPPAVRIVLSSFAATPYTKPPPGHPMHPKSTRYPPRPPGRLRTATWHRDRDGGLYLEDADSIVTNWDRARRCGAVCRHGGLCTNPARPNGRCRMHGGSTLRPDLPTVPVDALPYRRFCANQAAMLTRLSMITIRRIEAPDTPEPVRQRLLNALEYLRHTVELYRAAMHADTPAK
jgi:hypothetical protein